MSQSTLFPATTDADGYESVARPDNGVFGPELAARRKAKLPDDWRWFHVKSLAQNITMVQGAVPLGFKKNGNPKWPLRRDCQTVYVTVDEQNAAIDAWEAETGRCSRCGGDGYCLWGMSVHRGYKYQDCIRCGGNGKAVLP